MKTIDLKQLLLVSFTVLLSVSLQETALPEGPPPGDFQVSFIPRPWEVNVERGYLLLDSDWKFAKGAARRLSTFDAVIDGVVDPAEYVLRDGTKIPIGELCDEPFSGECDDSNWVTMDVPFNWYGLGKEMDEFTGSAWYRKEFDLDEDRLRERAVLHFEGVFYRAWVYLNGRRAGFHEGGYTPFEIDVSELAKPGRNLLAVRVSNAIEEGDITIGDWWNYGGIHRDVYLEFTASTRIDSITVKTALEPDLSGAEVNFHIEVSGDSTRAAQAYIYRLDGEKKEEIDSAAVGIAGPGGVEIPWETGNPALWSPDNPNLYFTKIILRDDSGEIVDGLGTIFGIRKFEVRGTELYLNNEKVFMRGVNRHDEFFHGEFPDAGRVMTAEERISEFSKIREMNANSMRTAHYPNHPDNYYITDRLGIMVIEEGGPVGGPLNDDKYIAKIKRQLEEMYLRDRNHPSIIMWSIGNEFGGDTYLKYIREASEFMRSLDTRPLTFTETASRDVREGFEYVDVLSRNEYMGWYYGGPLMPELDPGKLESIVKDGVNGLLDKYHEEYPGKPIFIMEVGAESVCGRHAEAPEKSLARGDEEYQEQVLKHQFDTLLQRHYVAGIFPWILSDFKTQSSGGTCQFTPHLNRKGLLCTDRTEKKAYKLVQDTYGSME